MTSTFKGLQLFYMECFDFHGQPNTIINIILDFNTWMKILSIRHGQITLAIEEFHFFALNKF